MASTLLDLYHWATMPPEDADFCRQNFDWKNRNAVSSRLQETDGRAAPWTIDFHVAQNDAHRAGIRFARQDRPALPGHRCRTANSIFRATPAYWLRHEKGDVSRRNASTSAGTGACSPNERHDEARTPGTTSSAAMLSVCEVSMDGTKVTAPSANSCSLARYAGRGEGEASSSAQKRRTLTQLFPWVHGEGEKK